MNDRGTVKEATSLCRNTFRLISTLHTGSRQGSFDVIETWESQTHFVLNRGWKSETRHFLTNTASSGESRECDLTLHDWILHHRRPPGDVAMWGFAAVFTLWSVWMGHLWKKGILQTKPLPNPTACNQRKLLSIQIKASNLLLQRLLTRPRGSCSSEELKMRYHLNLCSHILLGNNFSCGNAAEHLTTQDWFDCLFSFFLLMSLRDQWIRPWHHLWLHVKRNDISPQRTNDTMDP